jgi:hypothetical protein
MTAVRAHAKLAAKGQRAIARQGCMPRDLKYLNRAEGNGRPQRAATRGSHE